MSTTSTTKKITLTTVKKFIKENRSKLFINVKSSFDGMTDCCEQVKGGFVKADETNNDSSYTLGVKGAYFVGSSRDSFDAYEDDHFTGIKVYNSCGRFILAVAK